MKVIVNYNVDFDVDIPKEEIVNAVATHGENFLELGEWLEELAEKYCPAIGASLSQAAGACISGVYQDYEWSEDGCRFPEPELGDVIWED